MKSLLAAALALVTAGWLPPAHGATIQVNPVRIYLSAAAPLGSLIIKNTEASETLLQLQAVEWTQQGDRDELTPTSDLVVSPLIFRLPPNGEQIVRFGLNRRQPSDIERSYRLVVQEVPRYDAKQANGVRALLRLTLPIFVPPAAPEPAKLRWTAVPSGDGALVLEAVNEGNVHVQLLTLDVTGQNGRHITTRALSAYVLPGQRRTWYQREAGQGLATGQQIVIRARTDQGDFGETISLGLSPNVSNAR